MSLLEVTVVAGIMGVLALAMLTMQQNQLKSNNFLEFQIKRSSLESALVGQVLSDSNNCKCMFAGAAAFPSYPTAPGITIGGASPTQLGRYQFAVPGVCGSATMPDPLITTTSTDTMKMTSAQMTNVIYVGPNSYSGKLTVTLQALKQVAGPSTIQIKIPVAIAATTGGGSATFNSCSMSVAGVSGCRFCANTCGSGYNTDGGIIAAHWKDWDYVLTYPANCSGGQYWDISNRIHMCCAN